jgi:hypothetical protein
MARGALVGAAMAVDSAWLEAAEARELAAPLAEEASELALAPAAPVAEAAALSRLEASEEASLRAEERADSAPLTAEPVAEARAESAAEVMDDRTDSGAPAAEVTPAAREETMDWTWAEARPAPATRAMVEKRMLMDVFGLVGLVWFGWRSGVCGE